MRSTARVRSAHRGAGLRVRVHTTARLATGPLARLVPLLPTQGRVLDLGCGHGLLALLLAGSSDDRRVHAVDLAPDKVEAAQAAVARLGLGGRVEAEQVDERWRPPPEGYDGVVVADVLYLLGVDAALDLVRDLACAVRPGGRLVIAEVAPRPGVRRALLLAQETFMVRVARATAGRVVEPVAPSEVAATLEGCGMAVEVVALGSRPHPHVAVVATAPGDPAPPRTAGAVPPGDRDRARGPAPSSVAPSPRPFPGRHLVTTLRYRGRDLRYRRLYDVLRRHVRGHVIDVGGGDLATRARREGVRWHRWTVVEPHRADLPAPTGAVDGLVGDGGALGLRSSSGDVVLCIQVLEHVFDPMAVMAELRRVARPGSAIVVMVPQTANLHHAPHHFQNLTRYWVEEAARRLDLEVVEHHPLGGAWSTIASRLVLQYPAAAGVEGYAPPGVSRPRRFWVLLPLGVLVSAIVTPVALLLSLGDLEEEANNHLVVLRRPPGASG